MKNLLILATMLFSFGFANAQTFDKSLAGMYESTSGSDWVSLNANGTGKFCITSDFMDLGCISFTWESDEDQITFHFKDEMGYDTQKWCYWAAKKGIVNLDFPTMSNYLNFIKTR